jgi:hypothetical protein
MEAEFAELAVRFTRAAALQLDKVPAAPRHPWCARARALALARHQWPPPFTHPQDLLVIMNEEMGDADAPVLLHQPPTTIISEAWLPRAAGSSSVVVQAAVAAAAHARSSALHGLQNNSRLRVCMAPKQSVGQLVLPTHACNETFGCGFGARVRGG